MSGLMPKLGAWSSTSLFRLAMVYSAPAAPLVLGQRLAELHGSRRDGGLEPVEQVEPARVDGGCRAHSLGCLVEVAGGRARQGRPEEQLVAAGGGGGRPPGPARGGSLPRPPPPRGW